MNKQKGMTMIGWIGTLAIGLLLVLAVLRLVPVYLNYFKIKSVLRDIPAEMQSEAKPSPKLIRAYAAKRFNIEAISVVKAAEIEIVREDNEYVISVDYEHRVPFISNVSFLADFEAQSRVER